MNLLIHKLPTTDKFGRKVKTSFRNWINFIRALSDCEIEPEHRLIYALPCVYVDKIDYSKLGEYKEGALWFLNGGQDVIPSDDNTEPILDYDQDQIPIYSSFMSYYGINLTSAKLHWFEFRALMYSLPQDTPAGALMYYRGKTITPDMPEFERKQVQKFKNMCKIDRGEDEEISDEDFIKIASENWKRLKGVKDGR